MVKNKVVSALLIVFITVVSNKWNFSRWTKFKREARIKSFLQNPVRENLFARTFNPFSVSSWVSIPSQFIQYWFPLFRPAYYPSYLQKPSTTTQSTVALTTIRTTATMQTSTNPPLTESLNQTERAKENSKPKTENIFGVLSSPGDRIEYLPPPNEIEW